MKLTRDFLQDPRGARYEWSMEIEGRVFRHVEIVSDVNCQLGAHLPIAWLERRAQQALMRSLQQEIFKERML